MYKIITITTLFTLACLLIALLWTDQNKGNMPLSEDSIIITDIIIEPNQKMNDSRILPIDIEGVNADIITQYLPGTHTIFNQSKATGTVSLLAIEGIPFCYYATIRHGGKGISPEFIAHIKEGVAVVSNQSHICF